MSNTNTGGPAFPVLVVDRPKELIHFNGMTLRDYFAAKASEADIAEFMPSTMGELNLHPNRTRQRARYKHADLMLKARES